MHSRATRSRPSADLPEFGAGVTLLDVDDDLGVTPVQALLIDHMLGATATPTGWTSTLLP